MTKRESDRLKQRLKAYSNLGIELPIACRNINLGARAVWDMAERYGWLDELCDMFSLGPHRPAFKASGHEGIRRLRLEELDMLTPQLHKRLVVRVLTTPWTRRSIKKEVMLYGRGKKADRHA